MHSRSGRAAVQCFHAVISLQSGSDGNCIYVEAAGVRMLFDAGISGIQVRERLAIHGRDVAAVDAALIFHDHVDHSRSMGILSRKFGLPIYATAETYRRPVGISWAQLTTFGISVLVKRFASAR